MNKATKKVVSVAAAVVHLATFVTAETLNEAALRKIDRLNELIVQAEQSGIDTQKEKMTIRTAEIFLAWANWDEANKDKNETYFNLVAPYKDTSAEPEKARNYAELLPEWERSDVVTMLNDATEYLHLLIDGDIKRETAPFVDWAQVTHTGDQLTFKGRPVFLADYTWKPRILDLTEYHGNQDGFYISPSHVKSDPANDPDRDSSNAGEIAGWTHKTLREKDTGSVGFIFINNRFSSQWAKDKYGADFIMREDTYTTYDIDHPGARETMGYLLDKTVPHMAGKKFSELGYMLCNEPHFYANKKWNSRKNIFENTWASGPVSDNTIAKFRVWLKEKHGSISQLNDLWDGSDFTSFDDVTIDIPIDIARRGTPMWYDWTRFNLYRVTEWYAWMKEKIVENDPQAKVHLKLIPSFFTGNGMGHGIDMEALTEMSGIIGNDSGAQHKLMWGHGEWEEHYSFEWREMAMSHDFYKSVSPDKMMYNTEAHYLSTVRSRDLFLDPAFARATAWYAHTLGLSVSQIWFWPRREDGSLRSEEETGYAGSNNQQARVTNEIATTMIDLNTHAEEIMAMQRQRKPIRIFYSKTSAINKTKHMDDIFELYEKLNFDGIPLGFATKNILEKQDHSSWDLILVHKTENVTQDELAALQSYLNGGGTVVLDEESLAADEYKQNTLASLVSGPGSIIRTSSLNEMHDVAMGIVKDRGLRPDVTLAETNGAGVKGCIWKAVRNEHGNTVLSIVNVGKTEATIDITTHSGGNIYLADLLTGLAVDTTFKLKRFGVMFCEVKKNVATVDKLKSHTLPVVCKSGNTISFSIDYDVKEKRDLHVVLQDKSEWKGHGESVKTVNGAGRTLMTFTPDAGIDTSVGYRWLVYLTPKGEDWSPANELHKVISNVDVVDAGNVVVLKPGYQIVSLDVVPDSLNIKKILEPALDDITFVQAGNRSTFTKKNGLWNNAIGNWDVNQAYIVHAHNPVTFTVRGEQKPSSKVTLKKGLNLVPVYESSDIKPNEFFTEILPYTDWIRSADGEYLRKVDGAWVNSISTIKAGTGFVIKVSDDCELTY